MEWLGKSLLKISHHGYSELFMWLYVALLDVKLGLVSEIWHQNKIWQKKKIFFRQFHLSRFLAKSLRVNKTAMKNFLKNLSFGVGFSCRFRHSCIKLTHTTWVVSEARPQSWLKGCSGQLCMYVCTRMCFPHENNIYDMIWPHV